MAAIPVDGLHFVLLLRVRHFLIPLAMSQSSQTVYRDICDVYQRLTASIESVFVCCVAH